MKFENPLLGGNFFVLWEDDHSYKIHQYRSGRRSKLVGIPVIFTWPCRGTALEYVCNGWGLWERKSFNKEAPEEDIAWHVTIDDMHRYFTTAF